jgi:superfamily II DNA or RNA helicase
MSICVNLEQIPEELRESIMKELSVSAKGGIPGYEKDVTIYPYDVSDEKVTLPFYYGCQKLKFFPNDKKKFPIKALEFVGQMRPYQLEKITEAIQRLNTVRCCFLSMATGKGKTFTSLYIASRLKMKTLVFLHQLNLFEQWEESIKKGMPKAKVQTLATKTALDPDADFYLINPSNIVKRPKEDFESIGLLIVDEAHALCSEKRSRAMLAVQPKYCIGLTASPKRSDGLDKILDLHFSTHRIHVPLWVEHKYYKFNTGFVPEVRKNFQGHTDWNSVLEYQSNHPERNELIVRVCRFFSDRNILVLCKRVEHAKTIYQLLADQKESVDYTTGTKKKFDKEARVLVSTFSKSGVGFDHPKLDMMIVAADVKEMFDQYFGRCVRREDVTPIFVDFVDELKTLAAHYRERKKYALSVGGTECDFHRSFPTFSTSTVVDV